MIIGTAGHIDHGKTLLVRALTGVDTDRLKEEKARGISIDLGFAYLPAPSGSVLGFVDVPGHERFIHNMLAGAAGVDFTLFVVAANDGIMPQTREHLAIIDLLGIKRGIVALTKIDLVPPSQRQDAVSDIRRLLKDTALENCDIIPVSSVTGENIDSLRRRLFEEADTVRERAGAARFRFAIDRSFTLRGVGTVVTGTVLSGSVSTGDRITISPAGLSARVRSIHAQNRVADIGFVGQRCALNLVGEGIAKEAVARGDMALDPGLHAPTDRIDAALRLLATEKKSLTQWLPVRLHHAAIEVGAHIVLLSDAQIKPGDDAFVQLVLEKPIAAAAGDRFILRDTTAQRTIGGGRFLDLRAPARKRRTSERIAKLRACSYEDLDEVVSALLEMPGQLVDLTTLARDRACSEQQLKAIVEPLGTIEIAAANRTFALSASTWHAFKRDLLAVLQAFHAENPLLPGIGLEKLRMQLRPRLTAPAFLSILDGLVRTKEIALTGARVRLAGHIIRLTPEESNLWAHVVPLLAGNDRFHPPRLRDIAGALEIREGVLRKLFKSLAQACQVVEIAEDHFLLSEAVAELLDIVTDISASTQCGQFTAAEFRDRLNIGRKLAIQILEYFDRHGVTLRRGDARSVNEPRIEAFRAKVAVSDNSASPGRESSPVGRPDFKSGRGRETVLGGFDSLSLPPNSPFAGGARRRTARNV